MSTAPVHVLVTGVTGFLGKVVLEELLRRSAELNIERVYVVIRPRKDKGPAERFDALASSPCFAKLDASWVDKVQVLAGDLCEDHGGLSATDQSLLAERVTHIAHCAASVDFDLPIADAARSNVRTALSVLALAKTCSQLVSMVSVSTAYVQPHRPGALPVEERLVPLPRPAASIYQSIVDGRADQDALLAETGHPNTYTYTKCLTEHLLVQNRGDVPLRIVRPSIISAAWEQPFRGWIDSKAAFAGFVLMIGMGYLKNVVGDMDTRLDVVPVDVVADRILGAVFAPHDPTAASVEIRHAVAGIENAFSIQQAHDGITGFYGAHPADRTPSVSYVGPRNPRFWVLDLLQHRAPTTLAAAFARLQGDTRQAGRAEMLGDRLDYINRAFPYFTHNTFDFASSVPFEDPEFLPGEYVTTICRGAYRHILRRDEREMCVAGRKHRPQQGDLAWAVDRKRQNINGTMRTFGLVLRKTARKTFDRVTFDKPSFEEALEQVPDDCVRVIVPSHRSYADFLLCSYLFFERPDLGIELPHIAAAEEFGRIPLLGSVLTRSRAFYLRRGKGREDLQLNRQVRTLVDRDATLQFFIEGGRSRSRRFLPPRRGFLRCLQKTKRRFALLPIALSYERLPEEPVFMRELAGMPKPEMRLGGLMAWANRVRAGQVRLGRVHAACGRPVILTPDSNVHEVGQRVVGELQEHTVVTDFHLRSFVQHNPLVGLDHVELAGLLRERGMRVLDSDLDLDPELSADGELCMRYPWKHAFYDDLLETHGTNPAVAAHVERNRYTRPLRQGLTAPDPRLIQALVDPICDDLERVISALGPAGAPMTPVSARALVQRLPGAHLPHVEAALETLASVGILAQEEGLRDRYGWGPEAAGIEAFRKRCRRSSMSPGRQRAAK